MKYIIYLFAIVSIILQISNNAIYAKELETKPIIQLCANNNSKFVVQYHASGRARAGNYEFGCSVNFTIKTHGRTFHEAKANGLPKAKKRGKSILLKEAKKRFANAKILHYDVK